MLDALGEDVLPQTKTQVAYVRIRRRIEDGVLPPGAKLPVTRLAAEIGISQTPIREALRMLQSDGFVTDSPHRGMVVAALDPEEIKDFYALRNLLEPHGAYLAAQRISSMQLVRMRDTSDKLAAAVARGDHTQAAMLNVEWHSTVVESANLGLLADFCGRLRTSLPLKSLWLSSRAELSVRDHTGIQRAIADGSAEEARSLMLRHLERGQAQAVERFGRSE